MNGAREYHAWCPRNTPPAIPARMTTAAKGLPIHVTFVLSSRPTPTMAAVASSGIPYAKPRMRCEGTLNPWCRRNTAGMGDSAQIASISRARILGGFGGIAVATAPPTAAGATHGTR